MRRAPGLSAFLLVFAVIIGVFVLVDVRLQPGHRGGVVALEITASAPEAPSEGWQVRVDNGTDLPLAFSVVDALPLGGEGCFAPAPFVLGAGEVRTWSCPQAAVAAGFPEVRMTVTSVPGTAYAGDLEWVGEVLTTRVPDPRSSDLPATTRDEATVGDTTAAFLLVGPVRIVSVVPLVLLAVALGAWAWCYRRWRRRVTRLAGSDELRDLAGESTQPSWSTFGDGDPW